MTKSTIFCFVAFGIICMSITSMHLPKYYTSDKEDLNLHKHFLYFQEYFNDTVSVIYNEKIIFKKFLVTDKRYRVCKDVCVIETSSSHRTTGVLIINNNKFTFEVIPNYRYYYVSYVNGKVNIIHSNQQRDFY